MQKQNKHDMNRIILTVFLLNSMLVVLAQDFIRGTVSDASGNPLPGANVYIKDTYTGTITDSLGNFEFSTKNLPEHPVMIIDFIGYDKQEIRISNKQVFSIALSQKTSTLNEVQITAGAFAASEEKRAVMIDAVEVATTASSDGDIYGALATFPGAQTQGETGQIIVRGGESSETQTYIDGLLVSSPYSSSLPDLPARGSFSPFMFNGVMFSTGGYSAEYGQALSSVLALQTPGIFNEDVTSISLMNVGASLSHTQRFARSALSAELSYNNTLPYFLMAKHNLKWKKVPQSGSGKFFHRQKIGKTGMLKTDVNFSHSNSELDYSNYNKPYNIVGLKNNKLFIKTSYNSKIGNKLMVKTGVAFNKNDDQTQLDADDFKEHLQSLHTRAGLTHFTNNHLSLKAGAGLRVLNYDMGYASPVFSVQNKVTDAITAVYTEADIKIKQKLALRAGLRTEYSSYNRQANLAPRASLAYKITNHSQISMASGLYHQQTHHDYLIYKNKLSFQKAVHYLLNYQYSKNNRLLRAEIFYKKYNHLISYDSLNNHIYYNLANSGKGYATGVDLFFKDDKSIKHTTYWISYSFLNTKRKYKNYPENATPNFVSPHSFSVVAKYWSSLLSTQFSLNYKFNAGRYYNHPEDDKFMSRRTPNIQNLSASLSYITNIFGHFSVVHLSASNVLGKKHVYSYQFIHQNGELMASPVTNKIQRTIILGLFINIK